MPTKSTRLFLAATLAWFAGCIEPPPAGGVDPKQDAERADLAGPADAGDDIADVSPDLPEDASGGSDVEPGDVGDDAGASDGGPLPTCGADEGPADGCEPASSCQKALESLGDQARSGRYALQRGGAVFDVFCEMEELGGGWARVGDVDAGRACPGDWQATMAGTIPVCAREFDGPGERTAQFDAPYAYNEVAGYVLAYQRATPDAFARISPEVDDELHEFYVDGVVFQTSIQGDAVHLWTYAAGYADSEPDREFLECPCLGGTMPPAWLGADFHCESGVVEESMIPAGGWVTDDVLWDDMGGETCDTDGDPSWFTRTLDMATESPVTVRLVGDENSTNEDVGVFEMRVYVR